MSDFSSSNRLSVSDIKAAFEARLLQSPADDADNSLCRPRATNAPLHFPRLHRLYDQQSSANASMSDKKPATRSKSFPKPSIDSVLDQSTAAGTPTVHNPVSRPQSPAAKSHTGRPGASTRPSWIGPKPPERHMSSDTAAMRQPVRITYSSPGLQPPLFVFTSLSDPSWEAVEMEAERTSSAEWSFSKMFMVEEGEYQYKFRLGPGDWWVTDDSQPVVDDGDGNKNNLIVVKPKEIERPNKISMPAQWVPASQPVATPGPGPLLDHEVFAHPTNSSKSASEHIEEHTENGLDHSPLLKHESLNPTSAEQEHSPLFQHESMALGIHREDGHDPKLSSRASSGEERINGSNHIPAEADTSDKSLEPFPTDKHGIYETLRRASLHTPEESTGHEDQPKDGVEKIVPVKSLPSVSEDIEDDEELDKLHQLEEREADRELAEEAGPLEDEKVISVMTQSKGLIATALDLLKDPWCLGSTVVLALGVAVGWYSVRYA